MARGAGGAGGGGSVDGLAGRDPPTEFDHHLTTVFWGLVRTPSEQRDLAAIDAATKALGSSFAALDPHLADRPYVAGPRLTTGNILVGAACYRYFELPIERPALPRLEAWYEALRDREPFRTHVMVPLS